MRKEKRLNAVRVGRTERHFKAPDAERNMGVYVDYGNITTAWSAWDDPGWFPCPSFAVGMRIAREPPKHSD